MFVLHGHRLCRDIAVVLIASIAIWIPDNLLYFYRETGNWRFTGSEIRGIPYQGERRGEREREYVQRTTHGGSFNTYHQGDKAMFLHHTSLDDARAQALRNSHTCSDFGFATITPMIHRMSTRSHLLLQAVLHLVHLGVQLVQHPLRCCHTKLRMSSICSSPQVASALRPSSATRMPDSVPHVSSWTSARNVTQ